jgi:hypothetical protein
VAATVHREVDRGTLVAVTPENLPDQKQSERSANPEDVWPTMASAPLLMALAMGQWNGS